MTHRYAVGDIVRVVAPIWEDVPVGTLVTVVDVASDGGVIAKAPHPLADCDVIHFCARDVRIHTRNPK